MQFSSLKHVFQQNGAVNTYDGFRLIVQKQLNLNTVVSHFYWIGSQAMGQPLYQFRIILPDEDKVVNVATDMDFNLEGEVKFPLANKFAFASNFAVSTNIRLFVAFV